MSKPKKINTKRKGAENQLRVKKTLEALGWVVEQQVNIRFKKECDFFFGLFDLIALKDGVVNLVQVKSNYRLTPKVRKGYEKFADQWLDYRNSKRNFIVTFVSVNDHNLEQYTQWEMCYTAEKGFHWFETEEDDFSGSINDEHREWIDKTNYK